MPYKTIVLKRGKADSLRRFHPWVFSGAIQSLPNNLKEGEIVRVEDASSQFLAVGHYQIGSIAIRILSFEDVVVDDAFWDERLSEALMLRRALNLLRADNNIFRLVHGEGDRLPGLIVDIYGETAVMQAHSVGMHYARHQIAQSLQRILGKSVTQVYYKSETTLPYKANLEELDGPLLGNASNNNVAVENDLRFHIDWLRGQKTGFFIDQRENRLLLQHYSNKRYVLNMFCYTGGFSVYALRGGAQEVVSVDSSAKAIDLTNANVALNYPNCDHHKAYAEDAFKFLDKADDAYDLIVLDPPAFAKHKEAVRNALKGYTRLNLQAMRKIKRGGILFTFSCSQAISKDQFRLAVFTAAAQSGRYVRILHQLHQPADHPVNIYHPEGEYLKGLVLEII
ncbi:class I SAM-dependent rRNA methyltransferase [Alloprevotella tannerae]|uniref:Class I SAM-dependent rRNA methyltransferase n=1 Tax=Alloprevotella tannerae TaxID=76122 RepID=A0A929RWR5_9BACT|nr:class I SAM-dependent rRNA methyltransferase [Alloprevotella tannerae]MBF0969969.1 class I SAM-dependent rRNA methyltransferase [Alloprevotella tannerae]